MRPTLTLGDTMRSEESRSRTRLLSALGELRTGYQLRGAVVPQAEGAHRLIQLGDVREDGVDVDQLVHSDLDRIRERDFLTTGDLLLRSRGASYRSVVVPPCPPGTVAIAPLYVLRVQTEEVIPEYLVWFINQPSSQMWLGAQARGSYIPTISREAFASLEVAVPPLAAQRRIAEIASLLRQEKALVQRLLERRDQMVQVLLAESLRRLQS